MGNVASGPRVEQAGRELAGVFVSHPAFMRPGFGAHHPLSTGRQAAVVTLAEALGWLGPGERATAPLPDRATLERFHAQDYLDAFERVAVAGVAMVRDREAYNLGTMECPVFPGLRERALAGVGGSILAARLALEGRAAFHPAGGTHHGSRRRASGFCYLNDPVFAVLTFFDAGVNRVAYIDLDAHHGDGVEAAFEDDERVSTLSIHEAGRWPGTGQTGSNGRIINAAVPAGINDSEYRLVFEAAIGPILAWRPEAVVIVLGADALAGDPLSKMRLSNDCLLACTAFAAGLAAPCAVLGGGGYNPWTAVRLWVAQWARMSGRRIPDLLPPAARDILGALTCDLVDEEDVEEGWLTRLLDGPAEGPVRPEVRDVIRRLGE